MTNDNLFINQMLIFLSSAHREKLVRCHILKCLQKYEQNQNPFDVENLLSSGYGIHRVTI